MTKISKDKAIKVYDILIKYAKAPLTMCESFIYHHTVSEDGCSEWRFGGLLGNGGKYLSRLNVVTTDYTDDESCDLVSYINEKLSHI